MSDLVERGAVDRARQISDLAERAQRDADSRSEADEFNERRTVYSQVHGFLPKFYKERWIANPAWKGPYRGEPRMIEDPENPCPEVVWRTLAPGKRHGTSEFTCEGLTFRCYWEQPRNYGSDRADWDDGWWPTFMLVHGRWPFRKETKVYRPADVAEVLGV